MTDTGDQRPGALILGTRGSDLALAQASMVQAALEGAASSVGRVARKIIKTTGDQRQDLPLRDFSKPVEGGPPLLDKGIFTKELEVALTEGRIDAAVHSLKDVPSVLEAGFEIAGVLPRAAVEDVLISCDALRLETLGPGVKVGTGSVRRQRLLAQLRPGTAVAEIRGNVPTRLRKLVKEPELDAIVLARAGLERLGCRLDGTGIFDFQGEKFHFEILDPSLFLPAACQGVVAMEIRAGDTETARAIDDINHSPTFRQARAEREFLRLLQAGCQTPVGVHSWLSEAGDRLSMEAVVFDETDPQAPPRQSGAEGEAGRPEETARELMQNLKETE